VTVAAPLVAYLALGRKADSMLNGRREWLTANNAAIMPVLVLEPRDSPERFSVAFRGRALLLCLAARAPRR
jgi:hypothetical protein